MPSFVLERETSRRCLHKTWNLVQTEYHTLIKNFHGGSINRKLELFTCYWALPSNNWPKCYRLPIQKIKDKDPSWPSVWKTVPPAPHCALSSHCHNHYLGNAPKQRVKQWKSPGSCSLLFFNSRKRSFQIFKILSDWQRNIYCMDLYNKAILPHLFF